MNLDVDLERVVLPARAFFRSWRDQTLPTRTAALDDALAHFQEIAAGDDRELRDMALLGLAGEAMQPLEDLAYLGHAWDQPFTGLANYVSAITWSRFTTTNFWQSSGGWADERIAVFAGLAVRDPENRTIHSLLGILGDFARQADEVQLAALEAARVRTVARVRRNLSMLGAEWTRFAPHFLAYKHGGLAVNRGDVALVADDVATITDDTPRTAPAIAIWSKSKSGSVLFESGVTSEEIADYAVASGRLAIDCLERFVDGRLAVLDILEIADDGQVVGLKSFQIPWTIWLSEEDLTPEQWEVLGAGPLIRWIDDDALSGIRVEP